VAEVMSGYVERGELPGVVTLISRRGEVHANAIGTTGIGSSQRVQRDTLFRITSMTKPVTAAATMILVEECKLRLDEPVDRLLPELADRLVLNRLDGPVDDTVPANRPISVRDLGSRSPRRTRLIPTSGSAAWERCRSCTSRASSGCTTPAQTSSAC
jgi:CubicO group peptidase (beta-lactamase class C family)